MTDHSIGLGIAAAALALGLPGAALATRASNPTKTVATTTPSGSDTTTAAKPTRYCVVDTATGTRIPRKICHTREEWQNRGFDPLNPKQP